MKIGKVIGNVVSTRNEGNITGKKLMVVRYLDENLKEKDKTAVSMDAVKAKPGDIVLFCTSSSARLTDTTRDVCTDNTIVAIIDTISTGKKDWYSKNKIQKKS